MRDEYKLFGFCGLYCGACLHYRAPFPEGIHLLEEASRQGKDIKGYTCQGCKSDKLCIHPNCQQCRIRTCAQEKNLIHCGECPDYPCTRLQEFRTDGHIHHLDIFINIGKIVIEGPKN